MFRIFFGLFFLLGATALTAQSAAIFKKNGEKAFAGQRWETALAQLDQYQQRKPGDLAVLTELGICHYQLHHGAKAQEYLEYVVAHAGGKAAPEAYYYLARTLHGRSDFEKAADVYKQFLRVADSKNNLRANVIDNLKRCLSGMAVQPNDAVALVENMGDRVNTRGDEFAPLPSVNHPDRLYYAAARPGCNGGQRNDAGYEDTLNGHWCSDMFFAQRKPSGWEQGGALSGLINSPRNEVALAFGAKGQVLYFFRGFTLFSGDILADTAAVKDEYALQPPAFKSPLRGEDGDCGLYFFNDTTLLFASRRPGGFGGLDLYLTRLRDTSWTVPVNLGPTINSPYDETTPFLAADGRTLYFSSNRPESIGGLDVFRSVYRDEQLDWQAPVNSPGDDAYYRLSADGLSACFASSRLDSYGMRDLYTAYYKTEQLEQLEPRTPALFADVQLAAANAPAVTEVKLPALYYTDDKDVTGRDNQSALDAAAEAAKMAPNGVLTVTVHTAETGPAKFDLFYGIQRAQSVANALVARGVPANRILLYSAGSGYPASRTVIGAEDYPAGIMLNQRVEIRLAAVSGRLPFSVELERREVPEAAKATGASQFDGWMEGLCFRVEAVGARQILTADALAAFDDVMIESKPGEGVYHYTAGVSRQYADAVALRKSLQNAGFQDAAILAFVDGVQIGKADAVGLIRKYPELAAFIRG